MSNPRATGLGEPDPIGKKALFQPPKKRAATDKKSRENAPEPRKPKPEPEPNGPRKPRKRVRITTELTGRAMTIIQEMQNRHRLETGRALPLWRAVSRAIEYFGDARGGG
jgi:hypothetical protein